MKKVQRIQFSRAVVVAMLLVGLAGCVPQQSQSSQTEPSPDAAGAVSAIPGARETASPEVAATKPSRAPETGPSTGNGVAPPASDDPTSARVIATDVKPPKTWPQKSRKSDAAEQAVTNGFIGKSESMTSPNFGKKLLSPETVVASPPDYTGVAKGAALGELEAQYMEYAASNWKQTGEILIVGEPKVEDLTIDDVVTHRVYLCIDSSGIQVTESDGFVVTPTAKPGTRTALNIYDLQEHEGQLLVVNHIFPEDPNC